MLSYILISESQSIEIDVKHVNPPYYFILTLTPKIIVFLGGILYSSVYETKHSNCY